MAKNVYRIVNRAIKEHLAAGVRLANKRWGLRDVEGGRYEPTDCMCPMAMVLDGKKVGRTCDYTADAARVLSKPQDWVSAFVMSFDGHKAGRDQMKNFADAVRFGRKLRVKFKKQGLLDTF